MNTAAGSGGAYSLSTLNPHDACGTIRFVGNNQLQTGRPSGSGAKVRHGMRGQRYARLNLDLHAMTEAPESQTHVVNVVGRVLWHATIITRSPKRKEPRRGQALPRLKVRAQDGCPTGSIRTQPKFEL